MQLEDYLNVLAPNDIRVKGTRIGIETVLLDYLDAKLTAEQIAERYTSLSLEQVEAVILYYLQHKEEVDKYLEEYLAESLRRQEEQDRNPSPVAVRLRKLQEKLYTYPPEERPAALKRIIAEEKARLSAQQKAKVA